MTWDQARRLNVGDTVKLEMTGGLGTVARVELHCIAVDWGGPGRGLGLLTFDWQIARLFRVGGNP